jgi:hypothetical protein
VTGILAILTVIISDHELRLCAKVMGQSHPGTTALYPGFLFGRNSMEIRMARGLLLWLVGLPFPMIVLIWLLGGLH